MAVDSGKLEKKAPKASGQAGALLLENLRKVFAGYNGGKAVAAVDGVDLEIAPGQMVTLLGPSGCGKTTTLRMIAGFEQPTGGRILLEGRDITPVPANKRDMGMVFQSYALFPHLTVFENVAYGLKVHNIKGEELKARVKRAVELTELTGMENRQPNQLSGGQQQRVALARALVIEPKVLLFDEPLSNLDAKLREQMREELRRIQQELGLTGVYVTHDQAEAMTISDLVVVMNQGRIEQIARPVDIYRKPASRFVAQFIGKASFIPGVVRETQGDGGVLVEALGRVWRVPHVENQLKAGQQATLVVRPEAVNLGEADQYPLEARVTHYTYLGPIAEYNLELPGGQTLLAAVSILGQPRMAKVGEIVSVELVETALAALAE